MNSLSRKFAVPYNGDSDLIARILDSEYVTKVYELYGSDNLYKSGRSDDVKSKAFENDVKTLVSNGIKFNYLLNALSIDSYIYNKQKLLLRTWRKQR